MFFFFSSKEIITKVFLGKYCAEWALWVLALLYYCTYIQNDSVTMRVVRARKILRCHLFLFQRKLWDGLVFFCWWNENKDNSDKNIKKHYFSRMKWKLSENFNLISIYPSYPAFPTLNVFPSCHSTTCCSCPTQPS